MALKDLLQELSPSQVTEFNSLSNKVILWTATGNYGSGFQGEISELVGDVNALSDSELWDLFVETDGGTRPGKPPTQA